MGHAAAVAATRSHTGGGGTIVDPGEVLFVNENLGGHASMHLSLREALAEVHPGLAAEFVDVPSSGTLRRLVSAQVPGLARLDLDLQPLRFQLAESEVARSLLRRALGRPTRPDVLHVYTQSIALRSVALLRSMPSVVSTDATFLQGAFHVPHRRPTRFTASAVRVAQQFEQRVYAAATLLVAQSEWVADSLRRAYGIDPERIRVIPFGLHRGATPRRAPSRELPEITFVGATLDRKGGDRLLRVFRERLRDRCVLNLVTRDVIAPEPGVRVFADFAPGDRRLPELLARTSVFAFPTEMDNSPYCVLEAMRAAVPVVTTRVGALPEMVREGRTGVLTTHDDAALAAAIGSLLDDPVRAEAMGAAGRDHFDDVYDARITTRQLLDVLTEARDGHTAAVAA
jgi:glycosyltransferase involved in cell wall biosynthesis